MATAHGEIGSGWYIKLGKGCFDIRAVAELKTQNLLKDVKWDEAKQQLGPYVDWGEVMEDLYRINHRCAQLDSRTNRLSRRRLAIVVVQL